MMPSFKSIFSVFVIAFLTFLLVIHDSIFINFPILEKKLGLTQETPLVYENPSCDTRNMLKAAEVETNSSEEKELTDLYQTLLGIRDKLDVYAQKFRENNSDYINLFPLAYYHVTAEELLALRNGNYKYPKEKMEQMILFYDAYKVNRDNWESNQKELVEEHWKHHFETAEREKEGTIDFAWDDRDVLKTGIDAHIGYDLPRALYESFKIIEKNRLNNNLWNDLLSDFRGTEETLQKAFKKVQEELDYNLALLELDDLSGTSEGDFKDVIMLRNEAWEKARNSDVITTPQPKINDHSKYEEDAQDKYCQMIQTLERTGEKKRARNFGDPHLFTFDGYRYSFQLVGEFILAKSNDNIFEVQIRQSPINNSLSVDSAIAMKIGNNRVALYADELPDTNTNTPLRVNGVPTIIEKELTLNDGGKIYHRGTDYVFEWPTGEELIAQINKGRSNPFINITVYVFESQANQMSGLLGDVNGDASDDLRFRNGKTLPSRDTYGDLENLLTRVSPVRLPLKPALNLYLEKLSKEYGNDWRISQDESLFDYASGQSTKTFTLNNFPDKYLSLEQLSSTELRDARKICTDRTVEPELMEGCIFDVAFSGSSDFARAAARISQVANLLRDFGIDIPDVEREIRNRLPTLPGGIRVPRLRF